MLPCTTCGSHFRASDPRCPHCGASVTSVRPVRTAAAALLGLTIACSGKEPATGETADTGTPTTISTPEPEYGVTVTPPDTADTGTTSGVDYGSPPTDSGTAGGSGATVEPLYGASTTRGGSGS